MLSAQKVYLDSNYCFILWDSGSKGKSMVIFLKQLYGIGHWSWPWCLFALTLKTLDTFGICQRTVWTELAVSQHYAQNKPVNIWTQIGHWNCERIMEEKTPLLHKLCTFRCLISRPQNQILRSRNQIQIFLWENTSFSKTMLLQRELFHTINNSPLFLTK